MPSRNYTSKRQESSKIGVIYSMARARNFPINQIVKTFLNLSSYEEKRCFTINPTISYKTDNAEILKNGRRKVHLTQKEVSRIIGCSESLICYFEQGKRNISDIRYLYNFSKLYKIPLYVLIRNELGITNSEIAKLIKLDSVYESESQSDVNGETKKFCDEEFAKLFAKIKKLSKSDLQVLVFMKIVFNSSVDNAYTKLLNAQKSFELAKNVLDCLDDPVKMGSIMELLKLM